MVWHRFRDGPLVDGPVALLALPVSNPTSPGISCVSRRIDRFGGSRGVGMVGVLSARHIPRDRTSGIPVASLARPAGTWLSPVSRRAGPVALDARKVSRIAETASTPPPVKRTTLSRSGMPSIGQRPSRICTLAGTVHMGLFRYVDVSCFNVFLPPRIESRRCFTRALLCDAFRRPRLTRARPPATCRSPPWLVRSPLPASLDLNAANRLLQHDTTREHDSRLIDPRPSGVAFCCAPLAFAAASPSCRSTSFPKAAF